MFREVQTHGGVAGDVRPLKVIPDWRGKLCVVEKATGLPFDIRRVYYLYDVPSGSERGGHAHHELQQYLVAISGSFTVDLVTSAGVASHRLERPDQALYIGPYTWREIHSFSSNAVCLVLASHEYSEADYIRNRSDFDKLVGISE
ncbi:sugar 3,4-ketoisomerase [Brucella tritici]|uniref:sugar 3,4-ketoisomerase n=1 Tax=Brucella tritici TaxID=94626 RepID=UPI002000D6F2|nr:FdtA/QdtA family cupin domain-containing protein [Brucella tritici]